MVDERIRARAFAYPPGTDLPEVATWQGDDDDADAAAGTADTGGDNL
jgi:hypothetical protein